METVKTGSIALWEKWELVLSHLLRNLGLENYPIDLLNIAIKYSLSAFKWNETMYNLDVFNRNISERPSFENEFIVEYPSKIVGWFIVCFDELIILSNYLKTAQMQNILKSNDKINSDSEKTPEFIHKTEELSTIKGPTICYTLIVHACFGKQRKWLSFKIWFNYCQ